MVEHLPFLEFTYLASAIWVCPEMEIPSTAFSLFQRVSDASKPMIFNYIKNQWMQNQDNHPFVTTADRVLALICS